MAKQYYIKKNPAVSGPDIEWVALNGMEFYQLITSPAGRGRYFIDMDEFMIESTEEEYKDWRKEKDHADYLLEQESQVQLLPLFCGGGGWLWRIYTRSVRQYRRSSNGIHCSKSVK